MGSPRKMEPLKPSRKRRLQKTKTGIEIEIAEKTKTPTRATTIAITIVKTMATTKTKSNALLNTLFNFFLAVFLALALNACNSSIYDKTYAIEDASWSSQNPVTFDFEILDTLPQYNLFLEVIHQSNFNYQNVYCLVESYSPEGLAQRQINPLELASRKGEWMGQCTDEICTRKIPFMTRSKFDLPGKYSVKITQHSRLDPIRGIKSLRLIIEPIQS